MPSEARRGIPTLTSIQAIVPLVERLTGQRVPEGFREHMARAEGRDLFGEEGIGHSQLNELLLTLGFDRITLDFFEYVFEGHMRVVSYEQLEAGITKFRKHAMLLYGNVKFGFKTLAELDAPELDRTLRPLMPVDRERYPLCQ